ncbi:hypothetical protein EG68_07225 [Paragonimus skrjabini miyazakii]|uniref:DNA mismatch repair proteins mutS family domain-containing protein n=1 Tax=Paragonimus skrjabini miyazakii TaxID=59628 RepID=A0A8S9YLK9_9TREM|nr:hypothetical protein EG68_07225 [Paragonimus skrjabini miyazakii]
MNKCDFLLFLIFTGIQTYRCLPDLLSQLAEEELKKLRENISTCALIYFPLVGFLLKIPKTEVQTPDIEFCGLQYAPERIDYQLFFQFADNEMAYYRNDTTRGGFISYSFNNAFVTELDKRYGDVMYAIIDSETAIMHRLQDRILEHSKHILRAHQFAAEMDCLCAFAQAASSMKGVRPKLVQESLIRITNGWHPIQQLLSIDTIRNSFSSGGNHGRTTLVTGPNASGKSIYLKQIGLIIYLSQIGSFVPAEKAIIGPVDAIYVTSADDFNQGDCSAYSLSLNTASIALKHSTFKTTVLLDEFAHCINKAEAAALTVSIMEFFLRKKRPHLIASTHNMDIVENMKTQDTVKLVNVATNLTSSILSMNFPTIKHLDTTEEKEMFVRSLFPPNCNQICKSISALVQFLGDREALMDLEIFNVPLNVLDIQILNVNDVIYMDGVAMKYLQIFNPKYFGNNVLSGRQFSARVNNEISIFSKEMFFLTSDFFNVCLTKLGRITLEQWMRSPLQDVEKINQRLNATEFLLKTANGTLLKSIRSTLRKVENIPRIFCRMQQSSALPNDWKNLMQSLMSLEQLIGICAAHAGELYPVMQLMQEAFEIESLSIIQMWMVRIIDFEAIQKQHRFSVNQGLDSILDECC